MTLTLNLNEVLEATWPPLRAFRVGPWLIRDGARGGKRVSAATAEGAWTLADIDLAEAEMQGLSQDCLFMVRDGDDALDQVLDRRGYRVVDPVIAYVAPVAKILDPDLSPMAAFAHWPPLAICKELWQEGGIGPARLAVMDRVTGQKTAILTRTADRPTGTGFVAIQGSTAMVHALEVTPAARRQGSARNFLKAAAGWAMAEGADRLALVVTAANTPARSLYESLGMEAVGRYHYRQK